MSRRICRTLKAPGGDAAKATPDQQAVDTVLLDYLRAVMPFEDARATLARWNPQQKQIELGQRAINRYGCFSCHDIKGFEKAQAIGTDLSEEGSKLVSRLDFAFVSEIPHTSKLAWFETKLHDPRVFDRGRELPPLDKLRMPNYDFADEEVERLVDGDHELPTGNSTAGRAAGALGPQRPAGQRADARQPHGTASRCHIIETTGGEYLNLVADSSLGPPRLTPEGARVQPDWLYAFLREPITIRPWLDVRMPTFGLNDADLNGVIRYFGSISNTIGPFQTHEIALTRNDQAVGKELFDLLRCQQCHVLGTIPKDQPTANLAPDLRMAPDRLNPDWIDAVVEDRRRLPAGTAHACLLAGLSEVAIPAARWRRRRPDPGGPRPPDDIPWGAVAEEARRFSGCCRGELIARAGQQRRERQKPSVSRRDCRASHCDDLGCRGIRTAARGEPPFRLGRSEPQHDG